MEPSQRPFGKFIAMVLCLVFVLASPFTAMADNQKRVVRVGSIGYEGFMSKSDEGVYEGYGVEYLNKISRYAPLEFEYIDCSWAESLEMLRNKEIDMVCTSKRSGQRELEYDYSRHRFGVVKGVLYTTAENNGLYFDDYKSLNGKTIAFLKGSLNIEIFKAFADKIGIEYNHLEYSSDEDMEKALLRGEVDVIATEQMVKHDNLKYLGSFGSEEYYLMSYKDNKFMDEIDSAISSITAEDISYELNLYNKYYGETSVEKGLNFTKSELEYIENAPVMKVAVNSGIRPMAYRNEDRELDGITIGILDEISKISGLKFEYFEIDGQNSEYEYDYFRQNDISLISGIEINEFNEALDSILLSDSYFSTQKSLVARKGEMITTDSNLNIAIVGGSGTLPSAIKKHFPNYNVVTYTTINECLDAVVSGKADALLYNQYLLDKHMARPQYDSLSVVPGIIVEEDLAISPVKYLDSTQEKSTLLSDPRLMSILNKSIRSIDKTTMETIIAEHTIAQTTSISFADMLYKYRVQYFFIVLLCIGIVIIRHRNLLRIEKKNLQLAEAVEQAERANMAKSLFLSQMSHEIRTPMNAIVGITTIAKTHKDDPEKVVAYLNKIDSSSKVLLGIINDVLDMSAIESNKLKIDCEEFDIKSVLSGITTIYYAQCKQKGIDFSMDVDITHEILMGDSLRLNQILLNLVSNAYKFTGLGGKVKVTVSEVSKKENTVYMMFSVADTGMGISEELMDRIFNPFEQESSSTAKLHGGSGLGLSITKNLVDMMHGAISVESKKGEGSKFTVNMPFEISESHVTNNVEDIKNLYALVVDDDVNAREYTAAILDRIGIDYDVISNGEKALEMLGQMNKSGSGYDVCFIDWKMEGLDGVSLTKEIRRLFGENLPIIIMSAYDTSEVEERAKDAGANIVVSKPLFQSTVFNMLMRLSGGRYKKETADISNFDFTGRRVLLAEDNDLNTEIAIELLHMVNMEVDHASNGEEALKMFISSKPDTYDAILMDIQMPLMDGLSAAKAIRKSDHPQAKDIPIFAMTANAFNDDVAAALSAGMNGHIAKPIDTQMLYDTLKKCMK